MAPNSFFCNLSWKIAATTQFIPCPACDKQFQSRSGFTRHLITKHPEINDHSPAEPIWTTHEDDQESDFHITGSEGCSTDDEYCSASNNHDEHQSSQPHGTPPAPFYSPNRSLSPENGIVDNYQAMDIGQHSHDGNNDTSSSSNITHPPSFGQNEPQENCSNLGHHRDSSEKYSRVYHPKLDGKCLSYLPPHDRILSCVVGKICDKDGNELPPNSPPPPPDPGPQCSVDDWFPYKSHIQFELADFLYRRNQMSEGNTDFLLNLISAMQASHGGSASFHNHTDMHNTIDVNILGEAPWDYFTLNYTGPLPEGVSPENAPAWMTVDHEIWYHDPVTLIKNLLSNPDFKDEFDYAPYQEHATDGSHQFHDFMSGNWSWQQAVSCS